MIQANELRYGNHLIRTLDGNPQLWRVDGYNITFCKEANEEFNRWYLPIPITAEILGGGGKPWFNIMIDKHTLINVCHMPKGYYDCVLVEKDHAYSFHGNENVIPLSRIKFVHELENLYFFLSGKELELDLTKVKL